MIVIKGRLMMIGHQDQVVAWSGDNLVEVRVFELPRYYNNIDMRDFDFKLDTEINGVKNIIDLPKTVIGEDSIILVWTIAESHVTIPGRMFIQIRAFSADEEKWHSSQDYVFVQSSINATDVIPDPLPSEFEQMEVRLTAAKNESLEAAQTATEQVNATQNMLDTFSTITLSEAIADMESAGQAKVDLAEVQADRAQDIADTLENITVPAAISTPSLTYDEGAAPATPASGKVIVYAKTDGLLYSKDDAGAETLMSGADTTGLLDEAAHDALDHTGLTGIPAAEHADRGICFSINNVDLALTQSVAITAPMALTITGGKIEVGTAPTGAALICDVHKNGTTLWTTQDNRPTIADAGTSATITAPDVTSIAQGDRLLLMIDQIGSTVAGKDLSLTLYCEVA